MGNLSQKNTMSDSFYESSRKHLASQINDNFEKYFRLTAKRPKMSEIEKNTKLNSQTIELILNGDYPDLASYYKLLSYSQTLN